MKEDNEMTDSDKEILLDILELIKVVAARTVMSNDAFSYIEDSVIEIGDKLTADEN